MAFEFKLPDIGEGVVEGEIVRWLVKPDDRVEEDQPMVEVMTDKATVELSSPVKGKVLECIGKEGEVVEVGATLVVIESEGDSEVRPEKKESSPAKPGAAAKSPARAPGSKEGEAALATPAVRKHARDLGIDLSQVQGTGPSGRVTRQDVEQFQSGRGKLRAEPTRAAEKPGTQTIPFRGLRKKIAERMSQSKGRAAHYTYVEEVDAGELVRLRRSFLRRRGESGSKLTYLPFIVKAVISGLKQYPLLNATLDEEAGEIRLKQAYNIGIAVSSKEGLIVPVLKNADQKDLLELSDEISKLAEAVRQGKSRLQDLQGGTFTITSLGALGGVMATPIINFPEVAILGVHKITPKPVVRDGEIVIREMMNLSISLDHRVVDGAVGAEFMHHIIPLIENPGLLFLEKDSQ